MRGKIVANIDQITIAWLTSILAKSGALTCGTVTAYDVLDCSALW